MFSMSKNFNLINYNYFRAILFCCNACGNKFGNLLKDNPVKCSGRVELAQYLCDLHNKVNANLNKPIFDCNKVLEFWGGESKAKIASGKLLNNLFAN